MNEPPRARTKRTNERTNDAPASRENRRARHVRRRRRRRGRRDEPVRSSDADADAGRVNPFAASANGGRGGRSSGRRSDGRRRRRRRSQPSTSATPFGQPSTSASTPSDSCRRRRRSADVVRGVRGGDAARRGSSPLGQPSSAAVASSPFGRRAEERRRSDRARRRRRRSVRRVVRLFDVRAAVRRRIEPPSAERADADPSERRRRRLPVRTRSGLAAPWWRRHLDLRTRRARRRIHRRRCAPNGAKAGAGQVRRARDTSVGRWFSFGAPAPAHQRNLDRRVRSALRQRHHRRLERRRRPERRRALERYAPLAAARAEDNADDSMGASPAFKPSRVKNIAHRQQRRRSRRLNRLASETGFRPKAHLAGEASTVAGKWAKSPKPHCWNVT